MPFMYDRVRLKNLLLIKFMVKLKTSYDETIDVDIGDNVYVIAEGWWGKPKVGRGKVTNISSRYLSVNTVSDGLKQYKIKNIAHLDVE